MLSDFQNEIKGNANSAAGACACYEISVACAKKICVYEVVKEDCGGLSLAPGTVSDDNGCCCKATDIVALPCAASITERLPVRIEKTCQTICVNSDDYTRQCGDAVGCAPDCIWTSTAKHSDVSTARVGDTVTYTVTFSNHSNIALDSVRIFDEVPTGVTVAPDSIFPAPRPGETLQTGISLGSVPAGCSAVLVYSVTVNPCASGCLKNCAHAEYCYMDCKGCCRRGVGSRRSSIIKVLAHDICENVQRCFSICDLACLQNFFVYYTGVDCICTTYGRIVSAGYGIALKYVDCSGKKKSKYFEGNVVFLLPNAIDNRCFTVRFTDLTCGFDCCGNVIIGFKAILCYCERNELLPRACL